MYYSIFRNNVLVANVKPLDSSLLSQKKQQEDIIRLNFTSVEFVEFKIGDYILYEKTNLFYYLNKLPRVTESPKANKYECVFEGSVHQLRKTRIFLDTEKTVGFYRDYKFPLTGNAQTLLLFIVDNLNRSGGNFIAGVYKETDTATIDFNNFNAFEAISSIASVLGFDWYLEGNVLNFDAKLENDAYVFQVGRKVGFTELTRVRVESSNVETVVYGYGSTENMPPRTATEGQTYDSDLLTENRLDFEGVDSESKLENNTETYGVVESVQEFDDIKPEFTGAVTEIDETNVRVFYDTTIDFDINNQLLEDIKPKIKFLSGKLIGLTFNISYELIGDKMTMDIYTDESGDYPNDIIFAEVGDRYKLFDLVMPDSYIVDARLRLKEATQAYLDKQSNPLQSYTGVIDKEYVQIRGIVLDLGDLVRIISTPFGLDELYEIKALTQGITDPNKYSITFGDTLPLSLLANLKITNFSTQQSIYSVQKNSVTNNQVTNIVGGETVAWE